MTGESGDIILGENIGDLIFADIMSHVGREVAIQFLKNHSGLHKGSGLKNLMKYILTRYSHLPFIKNISYYYNNWTDPQDKLPDFYSERVQIINTENKLKEFLRLIYFSRETQHQRFILDYLFPRAAYMDSLSVYGSVMHPFLDPRMIKFALSTPGYESYDYLSAGKKGGYELSKMLARKAYGEYLPSIALSKKDKTSYGYMSRMMLQNSRRGIYEIFYNERPLVSDMGIIDIREFRKYLGNQILKSEDVNNDLGVGFNYISTIIRTEIWLRNLLQSHSSLRERIKIREPKMECEYEFI